MRDLLRAGAVEETSSILFQGPLFSVPKKSTDKRRVILGTKKARKLLLKAEVLTFKSN